MSNVNLPFGLQPSQLLKARGSWRQRFLKWTEEEIKEYLFIKQMKGLFTACKDVNVIKQFLDLEPYTMIGHGKIEKDPVTEVIVVIHPEDETAQVFGTTQYGAQLTSPEIKSKELFTKEVEAWRRKNIDALLEEKKRLQEELQDLEATLASIITTKEFISDE